MKLFLDVTVQNAVRSLLHNLYVLGVVCMWRMEVTGTAVLTYIAARLTLGVRPGGKPRPLPVAPPLPMNAGTCDWTAALRFENPPLTSLVCGRGEVL